jgi:tetratricopeptide (TPR) repeat protein
MAVLRSDAVKILFLAANPVDVGTSLRIDEEIREISQKIRLGSLRDQVELVSESAVRAGDLQAALLRHRPDVVHFSGHCSPSGEIILQDEAGNQKLVSRKALSDLFKIRKDNVRVVVLNACYGKEQAQALAEAIDFTIGMNAVIEDRAAIVFAAHFYQSLAFGCSVQEAFDMAVNQLALEGIDATHVPELLVREGVNAGQSRITEPSRSAVAAEDPLGATRIPVGQSRMAAGGPVLRGPAGGETLGRQCPMAFLPWMFASVAISLTADVLRRFVGSDGGWPDIGASVIQSVLTAIATSAAALAATSLLRPANALVKKAGNLTVFVGPQQARRAAIVTGVALVPALALWLSLPALAHYYNERGARFQYCEQPDLSGARESYQQAVRLKPSYAQAHYNLATTEEDLQPERAIEEYLLAIKYDSHLYPAYNNLARLYLRRGKDMDYESALNILSRAVDLSPQDDIVRYSLNKNLGWANYALKRYALAEVYLRRAISLRREEGGAAAHCLLAYVLKAQGKAGVAEECFDCVRFAPGETDVEAGWLSNAQDCLIKEGSQ